MRIMTPSVVSNQLLQNQSIYKGQRGNNSFGSPTAWDAGGIPTVFNQDTMDGRLFRVTFVAANTDQIIEHDLNRVPVGYLVVRKDQTCDVYDGSIGGWTTTDIVLKCTVAGADTTLYIF
jgi:hypothetical protein